MSLQLLLNLTEAATVQLKMAGFLNHADLIMLLFLMSFVFI